MKKPAKDSAKLRAALSSTKKWPAMRRRIAALSDAELARAQEIEKRGQRREQMLLALRAEENDRLDRSQYKVHLKVESNL